MMTALIEIENLSKKFSLCQSEARTTTLRETLSATVARYKNTLWGKAPVCESSEFWALRDVNLTIYAGERVGIIGNNGAGKSTLLKILSRIVPPTAGCIQMRGRVASLLEVGTGFHPDLTGRENIYLNGAILGMSSREIAARFEDIVAFAGVEKFLDTPVKRYSSGMFARLGFSIAAHLDPDILIVDEVLSVGDLSFQERCLRKLDSLSNAGKTILFVSHNLSAVLGLCSRGVYLEGGRVIADAPIDICVSTYLQRAKTSLNSWQGCLGDEHVLLRGFSWRCSDGQRDYCWQGETASVTLEVEVIQPTPGLIFGFDLLSSHGYPLASACTSENPLLQTMLQKPGRYSLCFTLPTLALRKGEYRLAATCVIYNDRRIIDDQVLLTLPVYPESADQRFHHPHRGVGLFLGDDWRCQSILESIHG